MSPWNDAASYYAYLAGEPQYIGSDEEKKVDRFIRRWFISDKRNKRRWQKENQHRKRSRVQ